VVSATLTLPLGERDVLDALRREARPLTGDQRDYDALLGLVGDARIVLLGEASHGTHEFYRERAKITKRLITEHGFTAVAIEGDWPDADRVNRYVQGGRRDPDAETALGDFRRFPTWMWRFAVRHRGSAGSRTIRMRCGPEASSQTARLVASLSSPSSIRSRTG